MDISRLKYFVTVAEELHFRKSADKLYVTQSALSRQISALERELGTILFRRSRHQVQITEAGRVFLVEAQRILGEVDEAMDRARAAGRGETGGLNVGLVELAMADIVQRLLRRFQAEHPSVELRLSEEHSRSATEGVLRRRLHVAFIPLPMAEREEARAYTVIRVLDEPMRLAIPENHRLAVMDSVKLIDLDNEDLIMISRRLEPALHDDHVSACTSSGFSPKIAQEVSSASMAVSYVAAGLGMAFVPSLLRCLPVDSVVVRELEEPAPRFRIGLMWNLECPSPVLVSFLDVCHGYLLV